MDWYQGDLVVPVITFQSSLEIEVSVEVLVVSRITLAISFLDDGCKSGYEYCEYKDLVLRQQRKELKSDSILQRDYKNEG